MITAWIKLISARSSVCRRHEHPATGRQFPEGMQAIERAIIEGVRAVGLHITASDFTWHRGR
jgi:hypothetical protein